MNNLLEYELHCNYYMNNAVIALPILKLELCKILKSEDSQYVSSLAFDDDLMNRRFERLQDKILLSFHILVLNLTSLSY